MNLQRRKRFFVLTDFGSAERIIEIYGNERAQPYFILNPAVEGLIPQYWRRNNALIFKGVDEVIIGSGVNREYVDKVILSARKAAAKSIVFMDSWVNFESRFGVFPDEIQVSDPWARDYAISCFPTTEISMLVPKRIRLYSTQSTNVTKVLLIGTPSNNFTENRWERHNSVGGCVCPEISLATHHFPSADIFTRPHPSASTICELTKKQANQNQVMHKFKDCLDNDMVILGRPSYAHYYAESVGVPAFFSERVNAEWRGPIFRIIN